MSLPALHPLRATWDELCALVKAADAQHASSTAAHSEEERARETACQQKAESLTRIHASTSAERQSAITAFTSRRAAGPVSAQEEDAFWRSLSAMDQLLARTQAGIDAARLDAYFPTHTYTYRFAAPGLYVGVGDFWLAHVGGKLHVEAVPGRGQLWMASAGSRVAYSPPGVIVRASALTLSLHIDDLGLRGDSIPSTLKHIREIELSVDAEIVVPMAFYNPPRKLDAPASTSKGVFNWTKGPAGGTPTAAASAAASTTVGTGGNPINALRGCVWRVLEKEFKFEVTRLDHKTKGTIAVPSSLLKMLINSLVPEHIKKAIVAAMPNEIGMLLALHADHTVNLNASVVLASLSLEAMKAPLDSAVEVPGAAPQVPERTASLSTLSTSVHGTATSATAAGLKTALQQSLSRIVGQQAKPAAGAAPALPGHMACLAAHALGMSALQARTWVNAQVAAAAGRSGGSTLKTAMDIMQFARDYNPHSRHRLLQQTLGMPAGHLHGQQRGESGAPATAADFLRAVDAGKIDRAWARIVSLLQRLVDEYCQMQLASAYEQASSLPTKEEQRRATTAAQSRAVLGHVDVAALFCSAETLYAKPTHVHVSVQDLQLRVHAESMIGVTKAFMLRMLQEKQEATVGKASVSTPVASTPNTPARPPESLRLAPATAAKASAAMASAASNLSSAAANMSSMLRRTVASKGSAPDLGALAVASAYDAIDTPPASPAVRSDTRERGASMMAGPPVASHMSASAAVSAAAAAADAAASTASITSQMDAVSSWSAAAFDGMRTVHSLVTRVTTSVGGWIMGGERGRVSVAVRQLQLEGVPGINLPIIMTEGFFPPGSTVTAIESRDERSDALGWSAAGAQRSVAAAPAAPATSTGASDVGRGTFSVMIAWPKVKDDAEGAAAAEAKPAAEREGLPSDGSETPFATAAASDALSTPARDSPRGRTTSEVSTPSASIAPAAAAASVFTPEDVEVMATIRIHRAWVGLRVDDAALLAMVQRRQESSRAGHSGYGKGLPPLHALEVSLRPAMFGSSYYARGMDATAVARAAAQRADAALSTGEIVKPPAFPYVLGIDTPEWTRLCLEVAAVEAFGDIPVLARQGAAWFRTMWVAAAMDNSGQASGSVRVASPSVASESTGSAFDMATAARERLSRAGGSFSSASASFAAAADAAVEAVHPGAPGGARARRESVAEPHRTGSFSSSARAQRAVQAQQTLARSSAAITTRLRKYLHNDRLHISLNLFVSVLSVPAPPLVGIIEDSVLAETGSMAAAEMAAAKSMDPIIRDIAGLHDAPLLASAHGVRHGSMGSMRKVLSLAVTSMHALQPTLIPPPGSAQLAVPAAKPRTGSVAVPMEPSAAAAESRPATPVDKPPHDADAPDAAAARVVPHATTDGAAPDVAATPAPASASTGPAALAPAPVVPPAAAVGTTSKSGTAVLSAAALVIDVQLAFLTLLEDVTVLQDALMAADAVAAHLA